jgi:hypothetical protein
MIAKRAPLLLVLCLAGCPNDGPSGLPKQLWLSPNITEAQDQLVDHQPDPF